MQKDYTVSQGHSFTVEKECERRSSRGDTKLRIVTDISLETKGGGGRSLVPLHRDERILTVGYRQDDPDRGTSQTCPYCLGHTSKYLEGGGGGWW